MCRARQAACQHLNSVAEIRVELTDVVAIFWLERGGQLHILRASSFTEFRGRPMRPSLPPNYHPSDDEEFMNPLQVEIFSAKAVELACRVALGVVRYPSLSERGEPAQARLHDRASLETEWAIELRDLRARTEADFQIDAALSRIDDGTYGYCEETDEPIGIHRLEARPIATLSIEAQKRHERMERTHRDD